MEKAIIEIKNFSSHYGDKQILNGVNLDIYPGDIIAILGTSGCGKTTLLKHIIGLLHSNDGEILLFDKVLSTLKDKDYNKVMKKIGVIFQNGALMNSITVGENIAMTLEQHSNLTPELIKEIVKLKLSLVNLDYIYDYFPSELSGGMKKRVSLARSIALDPEILFADEPGAGLDPVTAEALDYLFLSLVERLGMTLVVVTHEVSSIKRIAKKVCYLDQGKVLFYGPLDEAMNSEIPQLKAFFATTK